jgi:beta-xylosidase
MKNTLLTSVLALTLLCVGCKAKKPAQVSLPENPLAVEFGDPFVLQSSDGRFYMYGTSEGVAGFRAWSSPDLVDWSDEGVVYEGAGPDSWTVDCFWAPEVYERGGRYYLWYSANWKHNPTAEGENFRIGVAVSDSPTGPFVEMNGGPVFDPGYPIIDANLWFDDASGRVYLYYSRCCYKNPVESEIAEWARDKGWYDTIEESWIYGVELKPDFSGVIGEPVLLLRPPVELADTQSEWESRSVTSHEVNRRWTEGSFLIREGDTYYMMYSANFFGGANYAVGYATSANPLGPFVKSGSNPVLQKNTDVGGDVTGTGHCMSLRLDDGRMLCVYHGRTTASGDRRVVFIDPMEITPEGGLRVFGPTVGARLPQ